MSKDWINICALEDIPQNGGVCALVNNEQVAVFRLRANNELFALSNYDPIGEANVLSRGLICSIGEKTVVASPLYKQHFCLSTGQCLEEEEIKLKSYQVKSENGAVLIAA